MRVPAARVLRTDSREFVGLIAAVMATGALGIDVMLPALLVIGRDLGVADDNAVQWIISAYLLGMGGAQLLYGPLADRFGRRPVLMAGLALYALAGAAAAFATRFEVLLLARVLQGAGSAGARVSTSVVRDCFEGSRMARIMSLAFMVFITVPVVAPSLGQWVLLTLHWRALFGLLALSGLLVGLWVFVRLPETLPAGRSRPLDWLNTGLALRAVLGHRQSLGYTLAMTVIGAPMMAFLNCAPQLFDQVFDAGPRFPQIFALIAAAMAAASLLNARIVMRLGMPRVSHAALAGFVLVTAVHTVVLGLGAGSLWSFVALQALALFCFGLVSPNFGVMAMDPMGAVAGTASAVQGFFSTLGSALLGLALSQAFDGSAMPLVGGSLVMGLLTLLIVVLVERGRLFAAASAPGAV